MSAPVTLNANDRLRSLPIFNKIVDTSDTVLDMPVVNDVKSIENDKTF